MDIIETIETDVAALLHRAHAADGLAPIAIDDGGWLSGDGVTVFRKPPPGAQVISGANHPETVKQQILAKPLEHIEGVVFHYTDTRGCGAANLAKRLLDPTNTGARSWHVCVDAAGKIAQSVSAKCGSWHAGGPTAALFTRSPDGAWAMLTQAQRATMRGWDANAWAFGIELENAGELRLVDDRWLSWPFKFGTEWGAPIVVPAAEVAGMVGPHGWHAFTPAQVDAATRVLSALVGTYGLRRDACAWTHARIDPQRRIDPGEVWTKVHLPKVLASVFGS